MDQLYAKSSKNDLCYALVLVAVLCVVALSLVLQLLALRDEGQVALAQAAQAAVQDRKVESDQRSVRERKS
jgi:hypothetical protein